MPSGLNPAVLDVFTNFVKQRVMRWRLGVITMTELDAFCDPNLGVVARAGRQVVGTGRFELPTSRLSVVRSNQLSYAPEDVTNHLSSLSRRDSLGGGEQYFQCPPFVFP
uniref:Uncharacterized protein n=1 Tax=uncultured alpha proteobacterium HF0070_05I22 TaxID=710803 RepID=E0XX85_9PROT|nr:hypothetical protein [uncultured alpha proteobacterium HF0070_05I22]